MLHGTGNWILSCWWFTGTINSLSLDLLSVQIFGFEHNVNDVGYAFTTNRVYCMLFPFSLCSNDTFWRLTDLLKARLPIDWMRMETFGSGKAVERDQQRSSEWWKSPAEVHIWTQIWWKISLYSTWLKIMVCLILDYVDREVKSGGCVIDWSNRLCATTIGTGIYRVDQIT